MNLSNTTSCNIAKIGGKFHVIPETKIIETLQSILKDNSNSKSKYQYELKSGQIQSLFNTFYQNHLLKLPTISQIYFAYKCFELPSPEEKRFGILTLVKNVTHLNEKHIDDLERIIDNHINDWMVCDAFANKIVTQISRLNDSCKQRVISWKDSGKTWRMRACCIVHVNFASCDEELCFDICSDCIKSSDRFVQLGVGCLLRELSISSSEKVISFVKDNYRYFTRDALRYSIEKLNGSVKKIILEYGKRRNTKHKSSKQKEGNMTTIDNENDEFNEMQTKYDLSLSNQNEQQIQMMNVFPVEEIVHEGNDVNNQNTQNEIQYIQVLPQQINQNQFTMQHYLNGNPVYIPENYHPNYDVQGFIPNYYYQ